jgi:hypothetical protein
MGTSQSEKAGEVGRQGRGGLLTLGALRLPFVLLRQHVVQRPWLQLGDVPQLPGLAEVLLGVLAWVGGWKGGAGTGSPDMAIFLGMWPASSMMWARWSSSLL